MSLKNPPEPGQYKEANTTKMTPLFIFLHKGKQKLGQTLMITLAISPWERSTFSVMALSLWHLQVGRCLVPVEYTDKAAPCPVLDSSHPRLTPGSLLGGFAPVI